MKTVVGISRKKTSSSINGVKVTGTSGKKLKLHTYPAQQFKTHSRDLNNTNKIMYLLEEKCKKHFYIT